MSNVYAQIKSESVRCDNLSASTVDAPSVNPINIGQTLANKIELGRSGITTEVRGPLTALKGATITDGLTVDGVTISDTGLISGALDPVSAQDVATKAYTDTKLALTGGTMTGEIAMGTQKITGLGDPTNPQDAATKAYVDDYDDLAKLNLTGGTMSGAIAMGTQKITGLGDPTNPQDAATKAYTDTKLALTGGTMTGEIAMGTSKITGLGDPTNPQDVATKAYTDTKLTLTGSVAITDTTWSANTWYSYTGTVDGASIGDVVNVNPGTTVISAVTATANVSWDMFATCTTNDVVTVFTRVGGFVNVPASSPFKVSVAPISLIPTQIQGLKGLYDASNPSSMSQTAGTIPAWNDVSGNDNHLTTVIGTPTTGSSTQNSLNVVDFDGLSCVGSALVSINYYVHTVFIVCDIDSKRDIYGSSTVGDGALIFSTSGEDPGDLQCVSNRGGNSNYKASGPSTLAAWNILVMRVTATDMELISNGGTPTSFTMAGVSGGTPGNACIGHRSISFADNPNMLNGRIGELLVYDRDVTDGELNYLGNYLGDKWGIVWTDV
jgi:hypothetical protein